MRQGSSFSYSSCKRLDLPDRKYFANSSTTSPFVSPGVGRGSPHGQGLRMWSRRLRRRETKTNDPESGAASLSADLILLACSTQPRCQSFHQFPTSDGVVGTATSLLYNCVLRFFHLQLEFAIRCKLGIPSNTFAFKEVFERNDSARFNLCAYLLHPCRAGGAGRSLPGTRVRTGLGDPSMRQSAMTSRFPCLFSAPSVVHV